MKSNIKQFYDGLMYGAGYSIVFVSFSIMVSYYTTNDKNLNIFNFVYVLFYIHLISKVFLLHETIKKINININKINENIIDIKSYLTYDNNYKDTESEIDKPLLTTSLDLRENNCSHEWQKICLGYDDYIHRCKKCNDEYI